MGYNSGITTMGGRAGGGARGAAGGGSFTGRGLDGTIATYSLKQQLANYKQVEKQMEAQYGEKWKQEAAKFSDAELISKYYSGKTGADAVKDRWNKAVSNYKSGEYHIDVLNVTKGFAGATFVKDEAKMAIQQKIVLKEMGKRGFKL